MNEQFRITLLFYTERSMFYYVIRWHVANISASYFTTCVTALLYATLYYMLATSPFANALYDCDIFSTYIIVYRTLSSVAVWL